MLIILASIPVIVLVAIASTLLVVGAIRNDSGLSYTAVPFGFLAIVLGLTVVNQYTVNDRWVLLAIACSFAAFAVLLCIVVIIDRIRGRSYPGS